MMNDILERHQRIGQVLSGAFSVNDGPMVDWAEIGFEIKRLQKELDKEKTNGEALQAKIDSLMLEYCPEDISEEQYNEWASHQVPVDVPDFKEWVKTLGYKEE
jgi:hypothetical protein